jgi:exopolysaccharide biosynthesis polyprenyl glycosylphosphotransferase
MLPTLKTPDTRRPGGARFRRNVPPRPPRSEESLLYDSEPRVAAVRRDRAFRTALLVADVTGALLVVVFNVLWLGPRGPSWTALLLPALVPLVHTAGGLYDRDERVINKDTLEETPAIFNAATLVTVIGFLLESLLLRVPIGAKVVAGTWLGLALALPACRVVARSLTRRWTSPERCLVVGDDEHAGRLAARIRAQPQAELVSQLSFMRAAALPLAHAIEAHGVDRVVVAGGAGASQAELETIQAAKALGVKVSVVPRVLEVVGSASSFDYVDGITLLGVRRFGLSRRARLIKRVSDLIGATLVLALASPLLTVIGVLVKLTSPGPVLFRQTRIGEHGRAFDMLKFRSMYRGADRIKDELRHRNEADGLFKIAEDPRITRVGRLLRRTSLDELPQLVNVLRGEMSLVGPRPLVPEEDRQIEGFHRRRLHLTPGMTGPWQVLGSARIPLREMLIIDYLYVANWSLWGDVKVLLRTVGAMVARRGR